MVMATLATLNAPFPFIKAWLRLEKIDLLVYDETELVFLLVLVFTLLLDALYVVLLKLVKVDHTLRIIFEVLHRIIFRHIATWSVGRNSLDCEQVSVWSPVQGEKSVTIFKYVFLIHSISRQNH